MDRIPRPFGLTVAVSESGSCCAASEGCWVVYANRGAVRVGRLIEERRWERARCARHGPPRIATKKVNFRRSYSQACRDPLPSVF